MKVKALKSFGGSKFGHYPEGAIFELPKGVDWLEAGLVEEVKEPKPARKKRVTKKAK